MASGQFGVDDLVWAKMKNYPPWPGIIVEPPADSKLKKKSHYVLFYGTNDCAWILDEHISHHTNDKFKSAHSNRVGFQDAVKTMKDELHVLGLETESCDEVEKLPEKHYYSDDELNVPPSKIQKVGVAFSSIPSTSRGIPCVDEVYPGYDNEKEDRFQPNLEGRVYYEYVPPAKVDLKNVSRSLLRRCIEPTQKKIGFLGLGTLGKPIVKGFLHSKHNVTVWNRTKSKCDEFHKVGAKVASSPADVTASCDIIFCCVSEPAAAKSLVFQKDGILEGLKRKQADTAIVQMTNMDAVTSKEIAIDIASNCGYYLEAFVVGSSQLVENQELLILCAGSVQVFKDCTSCFSSISSNAYFLSSVVGHGSKMNLIYSMFMGSTYAALAEAMTLCEKSGLPVQNFIDILQLGPFKSSPVVTVGTSMANCDFTEETALMHQQNDMDMALAMGLECDQPMLVAAMASELYKHANLLSYAKHDRAAVFFGAKY